MSAVNPRRLVGSLTPSSSADEEGYIVFVYCVSGGKKSKALWLEGGGDVSFGFNL